jgi:hypothetical protein
MFSLFFAGAVVIIGFVYVCMFVCNFAKSNLDRSGVSEILKIL